MPVLVSYVVAVVTGVAAALLTNLLAPPVEQRGFVLFLLAVTISAWYGGFGPGLLATIFTALVGVYELQASPPSSGVKSSYVLHLGFFLGAALVVSALSESRRRSEGFAQAERERYAVILSSIGEAVIVTDAAERVTVMNPVAEQLTGWRFDKARMRPLSDVLRVVEETTRAPPERLVERTLREGQAVALASGTLLLTRDGAERPIEGSAAPVRSRSGALIGAVLVFRDVSARRAEERAREETLRREREARDQAQRAERRAAFLAQASAILSSSLASEETLQAIARLAIAEVADMCVVFAQEPDGMLRRVVTVHVDPDLEQQLRALQSLTIDPRSDHPAAIAVRTGQALLNPPIPDALVAAAAADAEHLARLRATLPRSHIVVPLVARGVATGAILLGMSASGRVFTEADIGLVRELAGRAAVALDNARLYEEAQRAIQVRDNFLSLAVHELRAPLAAALGNVQLLIRRAERANLSDERFGRNLRLIEEQLRRLANLVSMLLDVSRLEAGQLSIQRAPLDLAALVRRVLERAEASLVTHVLRYDGPVGPLHIEGDAVRLEQVLDNLLQNAAKYSPPGSAITVLAGQQHERVWFAVRDEGVGIDPAVLPYLFERSYRAPDPSTRAMPGMGIGLYVVREIVARHGGTVEVESEPGKGTTFTVWLPR
ncbi:MAG: ATP-binding protein [Oscillochloridaceae bacterium]|nr:ATP-binding protein [Chloroflexaceae bacterium]MDW8390829.1 ATP-binding protein [Oscillochloridaceae bacterium]